MILDAVDGLELPDTAVAARGNELRSLAYLWEGLEFLNKQVVKAEVELCKRLDCENKKVVVMGNHPAFTGIPMPLIASSFHWYAVSVCNYVRLVGWLTHGQDDVTAAKYMERVLQRVLLWRDKVASHFAITKPKPSGRRADSDADLAQSVMFPVGWSDRRLVASPLTLSLRRAGVASTARNMQWSLAETHDDMRARYGHLVGSAKPTAFSAPTADEWMATTDLGSADQDIRVRIQFEQ